MSQEEPEHRGSANGSSSCSPASAGSGSALERSGLGRVWANQWEPSTKTQHASDCYRAHFGAGQRSSTRTSTPSSTESARARPPRRRLPVPGLLGREDAEPGARDRRQEGRPVVGDLPDPRGPAAAVRLPRERRPPVEVAATQRGRDFAIILACLSDLGYLVEWRVVNAADYGFPQRRRRVFIVADTSAIAIRRGRAAAVALRGGRARARRCRSGRRTTSIVHLDDAGLSSSRESSAQITQEFGWGNKVTPFRNAGVMWDREVWTRTVEPSFDGKRQTLGEVLVADDEVPERSSSPTLSSPQWEYLKGAKREAATRRERTRVLLLRGRYRVPRRRRSALPHDPDRRRWHVAVALQARRQDRGRPASPA